MLSDSRYFLQEKATWALPKLEMKVAELEEEIQGVEARCIKSGKDCSELKASFGQAEDFIKEKGHELDEKD